MATLRKTCENCTSAKRKCIVQLPKCARCTQRGLECRYDLEPLNTRAGLPEELPNFSWNPSNCDTSGYCVLKPLRFREPGLDPLICTPGHRDTLEFIQEGFLSGLNLVGAGKPTMFVHPGLQVQSGYNHLAALSWMGNGGMNCERLQRLVHMDVTTVPVTEGLTALQLLLFCLAALISSPDLSERTYADGCLDVLSKWTQTILTSVQAWKRRDLSPWQEWLFGESVRRTIIMSYALSMAVSGFKQGYCSGWLSLESLPFDGRPGLWMAESPQAWIAAARARTGKEVGEHLRSLHEFAESLDGDDLGFCGDMFLALLVSSHNGHRGQARTRN